MATSATSLYPVGDMAGADLTKVRTSAQGPEFAVRTRVRLNNGKIAMYVVTSSQIGPSATVSLAGVAGTVTLTALTGSVGALMTMNDVTTSADHSYLWVHTIADQSLP